MLWGLLRGGGIERGGGCFVSLGDDTMEFWFWFWFGFGLGMSFFGVVRREGRVDGYSCAVS